MILTVSPNRMELLRLRRRLAVARRGHRLLKDKLDGLIQEFISVVRLAQTLRADVEARLASVYGRALRACGSMPPAALAAALGTAASTLDVGAEEVNLMSVRVAKLEVERRGELFPYGYEGTAAELDAAVLEMDRLLPDLIRLAEADKTVERLGDEIEKTRRRVNALEHVLIPNLEDTIRFITLKLDEMARSTVSALMRIKELLRGQRGASGRAGAPQAGIAF
ncbi:MAG: V-type ATP synthase subunit D [Nitrospinota bacterium]